jgi:GT2 family glycosyltransferase
LKVSIIIVNHNTPAVLAECIRSLCSFEDAMQIEIIIADNCSADNSKEVIMKLASEHKNIKTVFLEDLKSFSYANNCGADLSIGEYLLIMNPDIIFTAPVVIELTNKLNENPEIGAISPALLGTNGLFQRNYFQRYPSIRQFVYYYSFLAGLFNKSAKRMNRFLENQEIDKDSHRIYYTEQIPCAFFLIKREVYFSIGKLDEDYTLFFEDVDICYRISKTKKLAVDTSVSVTHLGGSSFEFAGNWNLYGLFINSMLVFFNKHYSPLHAALLKIIVRVNSWAVLTAEALKSIFGSKNEYRMKKHRSMLRLMNEDK